MVAKKKVDGQQEGQVTEVKKPKYLISLEVVGKDDEIFVVTLDTASRHLARSISLLAKENNLDCKVTLEAAPRVVKFKGIE